MKKKLKNIWNTIVKKHNWRIITSRHLYKVIKIVGKVLLFQKTINYCYISLLMGCIFLMINYKGHQNFKKGQNLKTMSWQSWSQPSYKSKWIHSDCLSKASFSLWLKKKKISKANLSRWLYISNKKIRQNQMSIFINSKNCSNKDWKQNRRIPICFVENWFKNTNNSTTT